MKKEERKKKKEGERLKGWNEVTPNRGGGREVKEWQKNSLKGEERKEGEWERKKK